MAKTRRGANQDTDDIKAQGFTKSLVEDVDNYLVDDNSWTQARNAINNSKTGDIGSLGNEASNKFCIAITSDGTPTGSPLSIIGAIHIKADAFVIYSTDDSNHEIGIFKEDSCEYFKLVGAQCLNFSRANLITGVSKQDFQCRWNVYWSDGVNPDRIITIDVDNPANNAYTNIDSPIPWIQIDTTPSGPCSTLENTSNLDCDKLRLEPLTVQPCLRVEKGTTGGTIPNGSYYVVVAYSVQEQRVTDYYIPSNIQPLFIHRNVSSSLDIYFDRLDTDQFDQFELVLVQFFNNQTVASKVGNYSTRQSKITIDFIDTTWPQVSLNSLTIRTPIADKSDGIFEAGPYMLRVGPTDKFDFNYQPLANQIVTKWVNVEYPENYYRTGGSNVGYLRDEVYTFFIRWVYNTGDKSVSYHIPGRPAFSTLAGSPTWNNPDLPGPALEKNSIAGINDITNAEPEIVAGDPIGSILNWQVHNTAIVTSTAQVALPDGGIQVAEGYMGYWESLEIYDDNSPDVWNASSNCWSTLTPWTVPCPGTPTPPIPYSNTDYVDYDLCGKPIRHHKFPDNATDTSPARLTNHFAEGGGTVRIMGVKFENVRVPVDNDGNAITNIVGYEILRGSRNGQETIVAKGMVNNMFEYKIDDGDNDASTNLITKRTGLIPNYPYNDLRPDPFISKTPVSFEPLVGTDGPTYNDDNYKGYEPLDTYSQDNFTFHSPDTQFTDPFLGATEFKIYGELNGLAEGAFGFPDKHPKNKLVTDVAFISSALIGTGIALLGITEKRDTVQYTPQAINLGGVWTPAAGSQPTPVVLPGQGLLAQTYFQGVPGLVPGADEIEELQAEIDALTALAAITPFPSNLGIQAAIAFKKARLNLILSGQYQTPGMLSGYSTTTLANTPVAALPNVIANLNKPIMFYNYLVDGIDSTLRLIKAASKFEQYALQYNSHCQYTSFVLPQPINKRTSINDARYLEPYIQDFTADKRVNNLFRSRSVIVQTYRKMLDPLTEDNTRVTVGYADMKDSQGNALSTEDKFKKPQTPFNSTASSHYVGLKLRNRNQYGRIESVIQVPVSTCSVDKTINQTGVLFNGDTYVGRYTEKNTMFFFYNWMYSQPDGSEYNYRINKMIPHTTYWMDTEEYDYSEFIQSFANIFSPSQWPTLASSFVTPSDKHCLDRQAGIANFLQTPNGVFIVRRAFMYLFNSGVRDFYVESSINVDLRDWGEPLFERFYDPYEFTDLGQLFSTDIIKSGNYFKYDFSLSIDKLFNSLIPWGSTHRQDYNPRISEACYVYRPNRVIYSLPQSLESRKDYWRVFLPLNYKDFRSKVTTIKNINLNGAIILFEDESPVQFLGSENLTLGAGTRVTIGDGGLFSQALQYMDNSDRPYGYGSCQNRMSVVSTPTGIFYISQNQGKIFAIGGKGIQEISLPGQLKWWFAQYLPYQLTNYFPDFELIDNPLIGIGCQSIYDNENMLMYFCKKDYILRPDSPFTLTYLRRNIFRVEETGLIVELGDPAYFQDASWTISYDPKMGLWVSYHDWHPTYLIPGKNTFMSVMNNSVWLHNYLCDSYCNYYGTDYPFEIEFQSDTVQQMTTMRSLEYQLECYEYADNCYDRYHNLYFNFDECIIYNSEQCSGLLKLNLMPSNDTVHVVTYPIINPNSIDILYSKVENKYRFNQFWDITNNRGQSILATETIFLTEPNGYIKNLNPANLNYSKYPTERKKFRHYRNVVLLRRLVSGNVKMLFNIANVKNLNSPR